MNDYRNQKVVGLMTRFLMSWFQHDILERKVNLNIIRGHSKSLTHRNAGWCRIYVRGDQVRKDRSGSHQRALLK